MDKNKNKNAGESKKGKKVVVLFPGIRGNEIPLLYFAGKKYEDMGYTEYFIGHKTKKLSDAAKLYEDARERVQKLDLADCEELVFVGKSLGTVICCRLKEELSLRAKLVLLTPLEQTLPYIHKNNDILLIAAGDKDNWLETEKLQAVCRKEGMPYYIEKGVGHRMEEQNNLERNLEVIQNVISRLD